jgi:hypothetical protein
MRYSDGLGGLGASQKVWKHSRNMSENHFSDDGRFVNSEGLLNVLFAPEARPSSRLVQRWIPARIPPTSELVAKLRLM